MPTRSLIQAQANQIEAVLGKHGLPNARIAGGIVAPRFVRYEVQTNQPAVMSGLADKIALALHVPACRIDHPLNTETARDSNVYVEVPRTDAAALHLEDLCRRLVTEGPRGRDTIPPVTAVLGLDQEGAPLLLRLPSPNVTHVLIAGTTGSGKTALARTIVTSLALFNSQRSLQLVLIDPKGRGFRPFEGLPHLLAPIVTRADETLPILQRLVDEMERRDAEGRSEPRLQGTAPRSGSATSAAVVVVLDELANLVQVGGREMEALLTRLTRWGHRAGVHLVACTQKPTAAVIGGLVKNNFPVRLVGRVTSSEEAKVATGLTQTGAEKLLGQGDFVVVAKGQVTRMQAAYVEPRQIDEFVDQITQQHRLESGPARRN